MNSPTIWERLLDRLGPLTWLNVWLAYRLIWLGAILGHETSKDVYRTMWEANLDLPPMKGQDDA